MISYNYVVVTVDLVSAVKTHLETYETIHMMRVLRI